MVKIHGDVWQMRCLDCGRVFDLHDVEMPDEFALDTLPKCVGCQGFCRPNIVWFGEYVPQDAMTTAVNSAANCDLMIIVGTSGEVSGGYGFAEYALQNGATVVEINPARGALTRYADFWVPEAAGIALPRIWKMVQG
jgi:NAD-dependent deacetylase